MMAVPSPELVRGLAGSMEKMKVGEFVFIKNKKVMPYPRTRHCCATDGINLYMYGGYHPEYHFPEDPKEVAYNEIFQDLWSFNLATETWKEVDTQGNAPTEAACMSMFLVCNTQLLFFGGTRYPWGVEPNVEVTVLNVADPEKKWSIRECTGEHPLGKYAEAMVMEGEHIYSHGGCRKISDVPGQKYWFESAVYRLDGLRSWSQLYPRSTSEQEVGNDSKSMYRHGLGCHKNKLYLIGNNENEIGEGIMDKIYVFEQGQDDDKSWNLEDTMPCPIGQYPARRQHHSCVQWENEIYICGGNNGIELFDDIWKLELPGLYWTKLPTSLPIPTSSHTAAITPDKCMYVFGGVTDITSMDVRFHPHTNNTFRIWLAVPSLAVMAQRKLLSCVGEVTAETIAKLRALGIPPSELNKLKHDR